MTVTIKKDGTPGHVATPDGSMSAADLARWFDDHANSAFSSAAGIDTHTTGDNPSPTVEAPKSKTV